MSIYTRRGDDGETSLGDGTRVRKSSLRVNAYGTVDEANAAVGTARAAVSDEALQELLAFVQHKLFNCSSSIAAGSPEHARVHLHDEDVATLEAAIDRLEERSRRMRGFILQSGSEGAVRLFSACTAVRTAERRTVALLGEEAVDPLVLAFLNRCSDALFAAARYANAVAGVEEELWDPDARGPGL